MYKIPIANPSIDNKEAKAAFSVIKKGWISMGSKVIELEDKIKKYIKVKNAILFNNGTSALHAALASLNIKPGDEVIVPTLSYISSANVILYCGAKPVFCDCDPYTFNVTSKAYLLPEETNSIVMGKLNQVQKRLTPSKVIFGYEGDATDYQIKK